MSRSLGTLTSPRAALLSNAVARRGKPGTSVGSVTAAPGGRGHSVRPTITSRTIRTGGFRTATSGRPEGRREGAVEVGGQGSRARRGRIGPHHDEGTRRQSRQAISRDVTQLPLHAIPHHRRSDRLGHDKTHSCRRGRIRTGAVQMDDQGLTTGATTFAHSSCEFTAVTHAVSAGQHPSDRGRPGSGGDFRATLPATSRQNGATGAGAHTQAEAVRLGTAPVVRLKRPLAHVRTPR